MHRELYTDLLDEMSDTTRTFSSLVDRLDELWASAMLNYLPIPSPPPPTSACHLAIIAFDSLVGSNFFHFPRFLKFQEVLQKVSSVTVAHADKHMICSQDVLKNVCAVKHMNEPYVISYKVRWCEHFPCCVVTYISEVHKVCYSFRMWTAVQFIFKTPKETRIVSHLIWFMI